MVIPVFVATVLSVIATTLLRLLATLLLSALVQGGGEIPEGSDEVNPEISLGFVRLFDRLGDFLDGSGEGVERGLDALEAGRDAFENFCVGIGFRGAHERCFFCSEWAQEEG